MSTSLLYHAFGIRGYDYVKTDYREGRVVFTIQRRPPTYRCPLCGSRRVASRGCQERTFRAVPIGGKPVQAQRTKKTLEFKCFWSDNGMSIGFYFSFGLGFIIAM